MLYKNAVSSLIILRVLKFLDKATLKRVKIVCRINFVWRDWLLESFRILKYFLIIQNINTEYRMDKEYRMDNIIIQNIKILSLSVSLNSVCSLCYSYHPFAYDLYCIFINSTIH